MSKPASTRTTSRRSSYHEANESSPLLLNAQQTPSYDGSTEGSSSLCVARHKRWPSIIALTAFCGSIIGVLACGFIVPSYAVRYAQESAVLDLRSVAVDSFTDNGVKVRVKADVVVDAHRVKYWTVRTVGRMGAAIIGSVNVDNLNLNVRLPEYDNALLGTAQVPGMSINIRNGNTNHLDFIADTKPGDLETIRLLANDYINGAVKNLKVFGEAGMTIRKGLIHFGIDNIRQDFIFKDAPALPPYTVTRLHVGEVSLDNHKVILANASAVIDNPYPFALSVPALGFKVSLPGCDASSRIPLAVAASSRIDVKPNTAITADVSGFLQSLPADLTKVCPKTNLSPMDTFIGQYLHGQTAVVYITGDQSMVGKGDAPEWLLELLSSVTVPVPVPGHTFDDVIQSFSLSNVNIKLPTGDEDPDKITPLLSATVEAMIKLPKEIDVNFDITRLKVNSDILYKGSPFGALIIKDWIPASSSRVPNAELLKVKGSVKDAPFNVTDYDVFQDVVRKLLFGGGQAINLGINGTADADIVSGLGEFIIHNIPASGNITLGGLPLSDIPLPKLQDIAITESTETSMNLRISLEAENPTPWEVYVPYSNVLIGTDGITIGNGTIKDMHIKQGTNQIIVNAAWDPSRYSGKEGVKAGEELLGHYISGHSTNLTLSVHAESFPAMPELSRALSSLSFTTPMPHLGTKNPNDPPKPFIESATMYLLSSSASFLLLNPLPHDSILISTLDGVAMYNGSPVGTIKSNAPFLIKAGNDGRTTSPRLPVDWDAGSVGFEFLRRTLWGELELHAEAMVGLKMGRMRMGVYYNGTRGVRAHVRP
ncbi:hypothetical protein BZA77DRAFT_138760 [Pyronema omphalodes]|nr:hypothetical protein BZA77DRAFT_138760 [Pyronema omphalodes]